jgi:hypothetical protein
VPPTQPEAYPTSAAAAAGRAHVERVMDLRDPTQLSERPPWLLRRLMPDELYPHRDPADVAGLTPSERSRERFRIQLALALYQGKPPPWLVSRLHHLESAAPPRPSAPPQAKPVPPHSPAIPMEDLDE